MKPTPHALAWTLSLTASLIAPLTAAAQAQSSSPSASASSSTQVYGVLDAGVVGEGGCVAECARTRVDGGVASGSRLGVRGREDLGNGTAAVYTLEAGILNDTGTSDQGGKLFGREAYVGLDGPLGIVTMGRQYNLVYETLTEVGDPFHGGMAGSAANLVGYTTKRYDNTIKYASPRSPGGWSGAAIYSFGESPYNSKVNRAYGVTIGYAKGAGHLSITHQRKDNLLDATGTTPPVDQSARNTLVAANLDFGPAVGYAAYGRSRGDGSSPWDMSNPYGAVAQNMPSNDSRDVLFGVAVPVGATTLLASWIHKDDRSTLNRDANQLAVGASYALSKRTDFYASFAKIQNRNGAGYTVGNATSAGHGDRAVNVGLRHAF